MRVGVAAVRASRAARPLFVALLLLSPAARAVTLTVPLNTPTTIDLRPFIPGAGVTGVAISTDAVHGITEVNGTKVTYSPRQNYFGPDSFSYYAFVNGAKTPSEVVTVTVTGRPDPSKDPNVAGLAVAQSQAATRFSRAQISNFQRRMESLHAGPAESAAEPPHSGGGASGVATAVPAGSAPSGNASGSGLWVGGTGSFGTRERTEDSNGLRFSTDGISVGADKRVGERLLVGMGGGYAQDTTRFGSDGTKMESDGSSIAAYASYQPSRSTFVDGLLGYGVINLDTERHVSSVDSFAFARRKGRQVFGSIAAGYEQRIEDILVSPYGRLDFSADRLRQAAESGAGLNALTFREQTQRTFQLALGVRAQTQHEMEYGLVRPRLRAEYRHDFETGREASFSYADQSGPSYSVTPAGSKRNVLLLGAGADFLFRGGLSLGIDYQGQRSGGADSSQTIRIMLSQELDGRGLPSPPWSFPPLADAVRIETGFTFDDNVSRGREAGEILSDKIYGLNLGTSRNFPITDNLRAIATGSLSGEKFHTYTGLGRLSGGLQAEIQYRGSADFDAATFTAFARGWFDGYESQLRDGERISLGVSARRAFTDRVDVYGEVSGNVRRGRSDVFHLKDYCARLNVDYSLGRTGAVYLAGEFHRGDTVSSGRASLVNASIADVFVLDDAFPGGETFAYRFDAKTWVGTLGYNFPLGPRDSIDLSWRRVQSSPTDRPSFDAPGALRYIDNQYSILYLLRF
jgi:outer membrane autotransporter protein